MVCGNTTYVYYCKFVVPYAWIFITDILLALMKMESFAIINTRRQILLSTTWLHVILILLIKFINSIVIVILKFLPMFSLPIGNITLVFLPMHGHMMVSVGHVKFVTANFQTNFQIVIEFHRAVLQGWRLVRTQNNGIICMLGSRNEFNRNLRF